MSRKRVEHIRFGSADFPLYFADFFLKYPHISQKNWLVYEKIRYFETALHHTAKTAESYRRRACAFDSLTATRKIRVPCTQPRALAAADAAREAFCAQTAGGAAPKLGADTADFSFITRRRSSVMNIRPPKKA